MNKPELLIPAGNLQKLKTALAYGADAVYVGAAGFSMRPDDAAFDISELAAGLELAHVSGRRMYVALNSMMFDDDMNEIPHWLEQTQEFAFDGLIVADAGVFHLVQQRRPDIPLHISTQLSTANLESVRFWQRAGAKRVVLARECSLKQVKAIADASPLEIEIFIHGAMCVAYSGRCLLSAHLCGHSGSRGECKHSCRWEWSVVEKKRPDDPLTVLQTDRETIFFGSRDLCLIDHIPAVVSSGARSLKIEGRMKSEHYIAVVTAVYRQAVDAYCANPEDFKADPGWRDALEDVSHRAYGTGFALEDAQHPADMQTGDRVSSRCDIVGSIEKTREAVHYLNVKNPFLKGETLEWIAPGMKTGTVTVAEILSGKSKHAERTHCGVEASVLFQGEAILPPQSILRRRKASSG